MNKKQRFGKKWLGLLGAFLVIHLLWYLAFLLWNNPMLPNPLLVYQNFSKLVQNHIELHLLASLLRIFAGMGIGVLLGFLVGLLMGSSSRWNQWLDPVIYLTYPIPKMALLPIVMLLFGMGEASKIIMIVLIVFPQVVLSVRDAVNDIPDDLYHIYRGLRATRWQQFAQITFPASLYAILSTSRISLGTSISILFFTENYGTEYGMGYYIMDSWLRLDYPSMYGAILILSLLGLLLFLLIDSIGWFSMKWRRTS